MKRFISLAMTVLMVASLLTMGAVPASASNDCPNSSDGKHDLFPFAETGSRPPNLPMGNGYYICTNGCNYIYYRTGNNINRGYPDGRMPTIYLSYRQGTNLLTPSTYILDHNFRYEVTKGENNIAMSGAYNRNVWSIKSFTKVSKNQVQAKCDFGTATWDIHVRPEFPFGWFIIIFGFGWIWW